MGREMHSWYYEQSEIQRYSSLYPVWRALILKSVIGAVAGMSFCLLFLSSAPARTCHQADLESSCRGAPYLRSQATGQRQPITKALVTNPRILIFDEAISALDYESERVTQANMRSIC